MGDEMTGKGIILTRSAMANPRTVGRALQWLLFGIVISFLLPSNSRAEERKTMIFIGDSITAGFGLDPDEAYPALIQTKIDTAHLPWRVVNAGISGDTTAGGLRRLDWILRQQVNLVVIELGANDGLRGIAPAVTQANLKTMIERLRKREPDIAIVLAGMQVPTNLGPDHTRQFAAIYPTLAKECHVSLIPFLLEGVGGHPELNQADSIHPTAEGHTKLAETVWSTVEPLLKAPAKAQP